MGISEHLKKINPKDFPEWVSDEALGVMHWFRGLKGSKEADRFYKLFKSLEMKESWKKVSKLDSENFSGQVWFALSLYHAMPRDSDNAVGPKQAEKWKKDVLEWLEDKCPIDDKPVNLSTFHLQFNIELYKLLRSRKRNPIPEDSPKSATPWLYEALVAIRLAVENTEYDPGFHRKHINSPTANRGFFIRALTYAFFQQTGRPYREVVATAASIAYGGDVAVREVCRATEDLEWKSCPPLVPYHYHKYIQAGSVEELFINRKAWLEGLEAKSRG